MSHIPLRKEKDCLNCGTIVQGRYCHECGQENVVPKETFWHMVTHFLYDITHFDSKFFETIKDLAFKPGYLSLEYMKGRRASYLHPVKMYVFTSAVFFLLFFSVFSGNRAFRLNQPGELSGEERLEELASIKKKIEEDGNLPDSIRMQKLKKLEEMKDTNRAVTWADFAALDSNFFVINITGRSEKYRSVKEYDSVQKALGSNADNWFTRRIAKWEIRTNQKYGANPSAAFDKLGQTILHRLPYLLFVSLPLFALILQVLYFRRKQFYYADHGVFTVHLYIFTFLLLLLIFSLEKLQQWTGWGFIGFVMVLLFLGLNFYLYRAMKIFYGQGWLKTFIKFLLTVILSLLMMIVLLLIFLIFTAFEL